MFKTGKLILCASLLLVSAASTAYAQNDSLQSITIDGNKQVAARYQTELPNPDQIKSQFEIPGISFPGMISPQSETDSASTVKLREPPITLKGAVEEASVMNKDISKGRFEVARFKWDYVAAQASRLPNVRVLSYLSQQAVNNPLVIPKQADAFVFVSALMPITQQYRLGLEARALGLGRAISQYKLDQEIDETRAKVKAAYYKLVLDQSKLATVDIALKYLKELKITTTNRVKEGSALKLDAMQVEAKLQKLELDQTKATNALQIDRERFNHLLGRDIAGNVVLEAIPPPDAVELNTRDAEERALNNRPEIHAADARRRQIRLEKRIRYAEYIPNLSIGAVFITLPGFNNEALPKYILAPGMFINYNAFDWGRRAFLAKAQSKSEQAAAANVASIRDEVLIDLHSQINKLTEARLAVKTTQFAREVALEDLRVSMNRYKFTSDKLAEVLQAQSSLAEASNNYHEALLSFWDAKAQFDRAIGE